MNNEEKGIFRAMAEFGAMGLDMALSVIGGMLVGYYLDKYFGLYPWLTLIFFCMGFMVGIKSLLMLIKALNK